ncbi:hypothetical protein DPMN_064524 [Dreissena polymorpha]|uniref:Uncharacterized protein n=1 Tax=Dreissena polymorpha TaxID=45954 RepID=A0A9D4HJJ0_DREPO|nr:hypothetical protein DPMN_064524 [Dreissena polymorpha]
MSSCADVFIELLSTKNWAVMCAGSSSLAAEVNSRVFWSSNNMLEGVLADSDEDESRRGTLLRKFHMQKLNRISTAETQFIKSKIRVTGLHMEEDFHVCYSTLQKQVDVQMASSTDVFLGAAKQFTCRKGLIVASTVNKDINCCLSCSEGKEKDFNKESLLQLSSLNKLVTEKKFSSCVLTVATSSLLVSNVARARLWTEEDCQQRDWIQDTNFTAGRVFSTTRRVRFTTRRAVTTRRLCGNNTTKNCTARRAVTERRLNMQHKTKNANIQTLMWTPSSQYIRVAYSCDKTVGPSHR